MFRIRIRVSGLGCRAYGVPAALHSATEQWVSVRSLAKGAGFRVYKGSEQWISVRSLAKDAGVGLQGSGFRVKDLRCDRVLVQIVRFMV